MPFPTKIALSVLGAGTALTVALLVLGGDDTPTSVPEPVASAAPVEPAGPLLSFDRGDGTALAVMGPICYEDTRGNDVLIFPQKDTETDCYVLRQGGSDLLDFSQRGEDDPVFISIQGQRDSHQTIMLGAGDSVVEMTGITNARISGSLGQDSVLSLPTLTTIDLNLRQEGNDAIITTPTGTIVLVGQTVGTGQEGFIARLLLRGGVMLERSQIRVQSVVGQGTAGNDIIRDTDSDDVIYPGLGDDHITLLGGRNRVHYEGGNDRINSSGDRESHNTLYIPFTKGEVLVRPSDDGRDMLIETPNGTVRMELQLFYPLGDRRVPFQTVAFNDGPLDEEAVRFLSETYQAQQATTSTTERARVRN